MDVGVLFSSLSRARVGTKKKWQLLKVTSSFGREMEVTLRSYAKKKIICIGLNFVI